MGAHQPRPEGGEGASQATHKGRSVDRGAESAKLRGQGELDEKLELKKASVGLFKGREKERQGSGEGGGERQGGER